jgi:hypothetical protein
MAMKFADTILKNFATSASIVISAVVNTLFFGAEVSIMIAFGIALVCSWDWLLSSSRTRLLFLLLFVLVLVLVLLFSFFSNSCSSHFDL